MHTEFLAKATGNRILRGRGSPFGGTGLPRHAGHRRAWATLARFGALLFVVAVVAGTLTAAAGAISAPQNASPISFYSDFGNMANKGSLVVRPATLYLTEDGSVALIHLKWSGWGTNLAKATGIWSASDGMPSQATGKRITSPARITLSSPGLILGHRVYRCFQIDPPHPTRDIYDHACMQRDGAFYDYVPIRAH